MNQIKDSKDLAELRRLLLEPKVYEKFLKVEEELEKLTSSEHIGANLKGALEYCSQNNMPLDTYFRPIIEKWLTVSMQENREKLVETLYPILGDMIKKSIQQSLTLILNQLNLLIEKTLSLDMIKWKLESLWTQAPLTEIINRHNYLYKVEHIFIIHKQSAQVLIACHLASSSPTPVTESSELTNYLLNYTKDVFWNKSKTLTNKSRFNNYNLFFLDSDQVLFCACSDHLLDSEGQQTLKSLFLNFIQTYQRILLKLSPDPKTFTTFDLELQKGLILKARDSGKNKISFKTKAILITATAILGAFVFVQVYDSIQQSQFLNKVQLLSTTLHLKNNFLLTHIIDVKNNQVLIQGVSANPEKTIANIKDMLNDFNLDANKISIDIHKTNIISYADFIEQKNEFTKLTELLEKSSSINSAARIISNLFIIAQKISSQFNVLIEYPPKDKARAEAIYIQLLNLLRTENIYDYHLIQPVQKLQIDGIHFKVITQQGQTT